MIVVDTSALVTIALSEPQEQACIAAVTAADVRLISAVTLAEALIVAARRGFGQEMRTLIDQLAISVQPVTEASARGAAAAYDRWGKGVHPAKLNFADCFAYALAEEHRCPLLYVGNDFGQTDIQSARR